MPKPETELSVMQVRAGSFEALARSDYTLIRLRVDHPQIDVLEIVLPPSMAQQLANSLVERPPENRT